MHHLVPSPIVRPNRLATNVILNPHEGTSMSQTSFSSLGVNAKIVSVLEKQGIDSPFPIQVDTLPDTLAGKDVLAIGKTGSGKTLALSSPVVSVLSVGRGQVRGAKPRELVLAPTRELATQVTKTP